MMEKVHEEAMPTDTNGYDKDPAIPTTEQHTGRNRSMSLNGQSFGKQIANNQEQQQPKSSHRRHSLPPNNTIIDFGYLDSMKLKSVYLKGIFSVNTTTLKTPSVLAKEIAKVLELNSIQYSLVNNSFMCQYIPSIGFSPNQTTAATNINASLLAIQFEIELVKVAILGLLGIQFHRVFGDFKQYKNLCSHILTELRM